MSTSHLVLPRPPADQQLVIKANSTEMIHTFSDV